MTKQITAILLSIIIATYPPLAYASVASWTATKVNAVGSTTFVEAIKGNKKSIAKITPSVSAVSKFLRTSNGLSLLHSTVSTLLDGVDWVMTDGSAIKYKDSAQGFEYIFYGKSFTSAEEACNYAKSPAFLDRRGQFYSRLSSRYGSDRGKYYLGINHYNNGWSFNCVISVDYISNKNNIIPSGYKESYSGSKYAKGEIIEKTLPLDSVAQQAIAQAKQGNKEAQAALEQVVREAIKAGSYNETLETNATIINDQTNTNETSQTNQNSKDETNKKAPPLDISSITNAISSLANRISSDLARLAGKQDQIISEQQTTTRVINTQTDEILERQKKTKIAIDEMLVQGKLVNTNIDRVIDELRTNKDVTKVGLDNIHDALEKGLNGELINSKIDEAIEQAKINNKNATDAFKDAINKQLEAQARENEKIVSSVTDIESAIAELQRQQEQAMAQAKADAKANTDRIVEAIEATKDKIREEEQEKAKPFELPEFCDWAKEVCDFMEDEKPDNTEIDLHEQLPRQVDTSIRFGGHCPADVTIDGVVFGQNISFTLMNFNSLCFVLSNYVKPIVIMMASYSAVMILGGRNESG